MAYKRISIFGLGYVGAVSAACFAKLGHHVVGIDPNQTKVNLINAGEAPIIEKDLGKLIADARAQGRLEATSNPDNAIKETDISLVCVGTPSRANGDLNTDILARVCTQIGTLLAKKSSPHTVIIRSTVLPGTMSKVVIPLLEQASGKKVGDDLGVCNNPEFLREGTAIEDFFNPPKTVIGGTHDWALFQVSDLYSTLNAPLITTTIETAEMVKYTDNAWHALKVAFGNEIGNICKSLEVDSHDVIDIFVKDEKLNISKAYLRPGFAFGGSCLPKDLRALNFKARTLSLDLPVLNSILASNKIQIERALDHILSYGSKKVGFLGFAFKEGTDDLRESPIVELIERLLGKGYQLRLYDPNVNLARLYGANKDFILSAIPHIASLMVDNLDQVLEHADIVVLGTNAPEFETVAAQLKFQQRLIDFVRVRDRASLEGRYDGINW